MITGKTLTGREAIELHTATGLVGRQAVVAAQVYGNGAVDLVIGEIVDPASCVIDEPDGAVLYVEYQKDDDYLLASVFEDTPLVLLNEVSNG